MKVECINVVKVTGNKDEILSEEKITGELEFVPMPNGTGLLMRPINYLIEKNESARKRGTMKVLPLSKWDVHQRGILELTKKECCNLLTTSQAEFIVQRKGWGKIWNHKFSRIRE